MRKILFTILFTVLALASFAQRPQTVWQVASSSAQLGRVIPENTLIFDENTGKIYQVTEKLLSTSTLADAITAGTATKVPPGGTMEADSVAVTTSGTAITFTNTVSGANYIILANCYNASGQVGYTISSKTATGFTVTPVENGTFEYFIVQKSDYEYLTSEAESDPVFAASLTSDTSDVSSTDKAVTPDYVAKKILKITTVIVSADQATADEVIVQFTIKTDNYAVLVNGIPVSNLTLTLAATTTTIAFGDGIDQGDIILIIG